MNDLWLLVYQKVITLRGLYCIKAIEKTSKTQFKSFFWHFQSFLYGKLRLAIHFWFAGTWFWVDETWGMTYTYGLPNCMLCCSVSHYQKLENHCLDGGHLKKILFKTSKNRTFLPFVRLQFYEKKLTKHRGPVL